MTLLIPVFQIIDILLGLYKWAVILHVIMSWLVAFSVVNPRNEVVRMIGSALHQIVEPALARIRRVLPLFGALDLSPLILILIVQFIQWELPHLEALLVR